MDHCRVCHGSVKAIPVLDALDVERLMFTLHHVITGYNDMFDHMHGIKIAFAKNRTPWKEDLFFAVMFACQKLAKYYTEVTPTTGMLLISAPMLISFREFRLFRKWNKGMNINPENETSYTTQCHVGFLELVENEYCTNHRKLPVIEPDIVPINNRLSSPMPSRSGQSSYDT